MRETTLSKENTSVGTSKKDWKTKEQWRRRERESSHPPVQKNRAAASQVEGKDRRTLRAKGGGMSELKKG